MFLATRSVGFYRQDARPSLWETHSSGGKKDDLKFLKKEAADFQRLFEKDVQFVFSQVQHHWHLKDRRTGKRVPMKYCLPKSRVAKKGKQFCKAGFPKYVPRTADGKILESKCRPRVVCEGVAKEMDLQTSDRRNMLGAVVGRRRSEYFSGTAAILASVCRSNTNVQANYRIPLLKCTHDADCKKKRCVRKLSSLKQCRKQLVAAQRAMKQMIGYFGRSQNTS